MERLTEKSWRNMDPWETCGQDNFCKRGCHENGGCTKGCIVPQIYSRLANYEDIGLTPEEINGVINANTNLVKQNDKMYHQLKKYRQAEEQGLLIKLPCKVGTIIYQLAVTGINASTKNLIYEVCEAEVTKYSLCEFGLIFRTATLDGKHFNEAPLSAIGKTIFLTREAAEEALKGSGAE